MTNKVILVCAIALGLVACGDDNAATGTGALDSTQSAAVIQAVSTATTTALQQSAVAKLNSRALTADHSISDLTVNCSAGGTITINGSNSVNTSGSTTITVDTDYSMTEAFNDCKVLASDGKTYTVGGSLTVGGSGNMTITVSESSSSFDSTFNSTETGSLNVSGDNLSVTNCAIDITSGSTASGSSGSYSGSANWNGTVCGATSSGNVTF